LPDVSAKPFEVLAPHHIDHVFATWYPSDRRSDILIVVDISGSMGAPAPGTKQPLIRSVARGCDRLGALLPDDSRLTLWEFGSKIDGNRDYRTVLARAALSATHRSELAAATRGLRTRPSGTGLYDTLLAAYQSARDNYRAGRPNQVVLFTDGINQDDPGSITAPQLQAALKKANDPKRPVALSVITFGQDKQAAMLEKVLSPVEGSVKDIANASEVDALFIHVAAGGLEH
jgi:Mg-chelatase subunit ChlD